MTMNFIDEHSDREHKNSRQCEIFHFVFIL